MFLPRSYAIVSVLVSTYALAACGGTPREPAPPGPEPAPASTGHPYTEADVRFMSNMIAHHSQAIMMAGWAPTHNSGPAVRRLAERVVNAQQDEIATIQQWLRDRKLPVPQTRTMTHTGGAEHQMLMPGMLTESQMQQLNQSNRTEFDRLFLTFMIQHHRGAVTMVEELFNSYGAARDQTVFKFANDVNVDQSTEIERMERMLAAMFPAKPNQ